MRRRRSTMLSTSVRSSSKPELWFSENNAVFSTFFLKICSFFWAPEMDAANPPNLL